MSITRGKAKTIIILSDAIAESSMKINVMETNSPSLKKGVDFIQGFGRYMRTEQAEDITIEEEFPYILGNVSLKLWKKRIKM